MITPEQIEKKQFTIKTFKGYDPDEVDDFLDEIVASYREALSQLQQRHSRSEAPTQVIPPVPSTPAAYGDVQRLLAVAQQTADQQIAEAQQESASTVMAGQRQADAVIAEAQRKAEEIVAEGKSKRNEIIGDLEVRRGELQSKITQLLDTQNEIVAKMKAALSAVEERS